MIEVTDDLRFELSCRAIDIVRHLLAAEPTSRSGHEVRFGRYGSFSLVINGMKQGQWFDHEAGEGGDMLEFIQRELRLGFNAAAEWGANFVSHRGVTNQKTSQVRQQENLARKQQAEAARGREDELRVQKALSIWDACIPIHGTPAFHYLTRERAIPNPISSLTVRYHPGRRAVVFAVLDQSNAFVGIQLVRIGPEGQKMKGKYSKQSEGPVGKGTAVFFAEINVTDLVIAEGPETGLTLAACTGLEVRCTLGTLNKYTPPLGRLVFAAADDDPWGSPGLLKRNEAIRNWRKRGSVVHVAHPWAERREDKSDFNDLLKTQGADAVRTRFEIAIPREVGNTESGSNDAASARILLEATVRSLLND